MFPVDIASLALAEGQLPLRPAQLVAPVVDETFVSGEELLAALLSGGTVVAYGGVSIEGEQGFIVPMIGLFLMENKVLRGWQLRTRPKEGGCDFRHIDTAKEPLEEIPFPNYMVYFVGTSDRTIVEENADREALLAHARFILPFISDDGPPAGIDWH